MNHLPLADQIAILAEAGDVDGIALALALDGHAPRGANDREHPAVLARHDELKREAHALAEEGRAIREAEANKQS